MNESVERTGLIPEEVIRENLDEPEILRKMVRHKLREKYGPGVDKVLDNPDREKRKNRQR